MKHWIFLSLLLAACGNSAHPGFKKVADDVHLRFHSLGDGEVLVQASDSIELLLRATKVGGAAGSLLSIQQWYSAADLMQGSFVPVFERIHVGDSISLIAPMQHIPWSAIAPSTWQQPTDAAQVQFEFALLGIRTADMMAAEKLRHRISDPEGYQRKLIAAYLSKADPGWQIWGTSELHYLIAGEATDTNRVQQGEVVLVSWQGKRLEDGVLVDDQADTSAPFSFRYGDQDQVIKGIETAVMLLREGQEGAFIIPAAMAFGERGVEGLVEPWAPMLYTVKLHGVTRR